jgi:hypothetical protein
MSPSLIPATLTSIDVQRLRASSDPSKQNAKHMSTVAVDNTHLSAYSPYQSYSNSTPPSTFTTPAGVTSENSVFSEYDYAEGDEFYGVDFGAGEQFIDIGANPSILQDIPLPTTELHTVEAYLPNQEDNPTQTYDTTSSSTQHYMSSNHSHPPDSHSPKAETHEVIAATTASNHELSEGANSAMSYDDPTSMEGLRRASDLSPHSIDNGDGVGLGVTHTAQSPRVTLTQWGGMETTEIQTDMDEEMQYSGPSLPWIERTQNHPSSDSQFASTFDFQPSHIVTPHLVAGQDDQEDESFHEENRRVGLDPDRRKSLSDLEIPNLKEQEKHAQIRDKNMEVEAWRSHASESTDEEASSQPQSTLGLPCVNTRPRASTTGAIPAHSTVSQFSSTTDVFKDPGEDIQPLLEDEGMQPTQNQLKKGFYFDPSAEIINDNDRKLLLQLSRHWSDTPAYPYITESKTNGQTANEAIRRYIDASDSLSMLSRSATWGTRRKSEPSIADIESIHNGNFLKRLSFNNRKEKRPSLFNKFTSEIGTLVRKRSDSKLKRSHSNRDNERGRSEIRTAVKKEEQSTLAPPSPFLHRRGASSPRLNTNLATSPGFGHTRGSSVSATGTSPKGLFSTIGSTIRRARSGGNLQQDAGLVGLWRESGGPPVPTLASPPIDHEPIKQQDYVKQQEYSDAEGEDEDEIEDEAADDGEAMDFDQATPITPNFNGFTEHVRRLYPDMKPDYLIDRIAHQQVVRYKALLGWRVKHSGLIANGSCAAGKHCMTLGGAPTLFEPKNQPRDSDIAGSLQIMADGSDGDSNPEGALAPESFPPGVPMPPALTLPAEFECQLCFRVKRFQKPSDWTKHVHEDVQPFTCTYPNCKEPKSFKRKADWVRHENERHRRLTWWTCTVDDCTHKCYRKDNFLQHLVREHKIPEPKQKSKAAAKKARNSDEQIWVMIRNCHHETTARPQDEPCKFCGRVLNTWKKLTVHLAKHMEGISLSVLRLVEQQQVDANTIISPVEALPIRQAPLTPVGSDRRPSNSSGNFGSMSASISPHVPPMSNFSSPIYHHNSPNVQNMPQFSGGSMYGHDIGYSPNITTTRDLSSFNVQAPMTQPQHGVMYDVSGMPYNHMEQMGSYVNNDQARGFTAMNRSPHLDRGAQSRGFTSMDHSPHMDQTGGFGTMNGNYTTPITQAQGYRSYPSSNQTLSPDPNTFVSGPPQMPGFQTQTLAPNQSGFASSPQHSHGYQPEQIIGLGDSMYQNPGAMHNDLSYDPNSMLDGQGGPAYPPSSNPSYRYQQ